jgi:integrase
MALLVECPKCKQRNGATADACKCGFKIKKAAHKSYWIEYYIEGKRRRERIGPSKAAAEQRLRTVLNARAEGKHIEKDPAALISLDALCKWYKELPEVKRKRSYRRDSEMIRHLLRLLGAATKIKHITPGKVVSYQSRRLEEPSPRFPGQNTKPATVNKEVTCLKAVINSAVRNGKLWKNLIADVESLPENNVRMRVLTADEFESLYEHCLGYLKPVVLVAYYMGMRRSEIIKLSWGEVDMKTGFIRLNGSGDRIRTCDLRVMSPTSYLTAPPRGKKY